MKLTAFSGHTYQQSTTRIRMSAVSLLSLFTTSLVKKPPVPLFTSSRSPPFCAFFMARLHSAFPSPANPAHSATKRPKRKTSDKTLAFIFARHSTLKSYQSLYNFKCTVFCINKMLSYQLLHAVTILLE